MDKARTPEKKSRVNAINQSINQSSVCGWSSTKNRVVTWSWHPRRAIAAIAAWSSFSGFPRACALFQTCISFLNATTCNVLGCHYRDIAIGPFMMGAHKIVTASKQQQRQPRQHHPPPIPPTTTSHSSSTSIIIMYALRSSLARSSLMTSRILLAISARAAFSTQTTQAVDKLKTVLESYRLAK